MILPSKQLQPIDRSINFSFLDIILKMKQPNVREYSRSDLILMTKKTRELLIDL